MLREMRRLFHRKNALLSARMAISIKDVPQKDGNYVYNGKMVPHPGNLSRT